MVVDFADQLAVQAQADAFDEARVPGLVGERLSVRADPGDVGIRAFLAANRAALPANAVQRVAGIVPGSSGQVCRTGGYPRDEPADRARGPEDVDLGVTGMGGDRAQEQRAAPPAIGKSHHQKSARSRDRRTARARSAGPAGRP